MSNNYEKILERFYQESFIRIEEFNNELEVIEKLFDKNFIEIASSELNKQMYCITYDGREYCKSRK